MVGNWTDDCFPLQSVFGRTGAVVAQAGDYTASQIANDTGLAIANPPDMQQALDSLYDASLLGDRPQRVINDEFTSNLYLINSTVSSVGDGGAIGSAATGAALSSGSWGWDATSALADVLREAAPAGSSMAGIWTIRSSGTAGGLITTRSSLYPSALSRVRFACRIQILPVAQQTGIGFFTSAFTDYSQIKFTTLSSSVFTISHMAAKASADQTTVLPFSSVNETMTVVYTLSNFGTKARVAIYNAAGSLVGSILEFSIPTANVVLAATPLKAGVYSYAVSNPANTPLCRVDYCELGILA